jgi:hypothetical protein
MKPKNHTEFSSSSSGLNFVEIQHGVNCPTILTQDLNDCICGSFNVLNHSDAARFIASLKPNRAARRKAARKAAKAMNKARQK